MYAVQSARRELRQLATPLALSPEQADRLAAAPGRSTRLALWATGFGGILLIALVALLVDPPDILFDPRLWTLEMWWHRIAILPIAWWFARLMALTLAEAARLTRLAERPSQGSAHQLPPR